MDDLDGYTYQNTKQNCNTVQPRLSDYFGPLK